MAGVFDLAVHFALAASLIPVLAVSAALDDGQAHDVSNVVAAATGEIEASLPPVLVEASRSGRLPDDIPGAVQVVTRADIEASGARDLADLLEKKSLTMDLAHVGAANPALAQIAPRGYGENGFGRLLVVVDGERLNSPDMNAPNLAQVGLGAIERIEILQGSQNVLHGDVGSAGLVNIVTAPEDDEPHGHAELHGGSWNTFGASASVRGGVEKWGTRYWANGGWDHSDGYRDNSGFDSFSAGGGVRQGFANGAFLRVSSFWSDVDSELPGPLSREGWKNDPTDSDGYGDWCRRTTYGGNFTAYGVADADNTVRLVQTLSHRHLQSRGSGYWHTDYDIISLGFTPEWINTSKIGSFGNTFIAGAAFRYDRNHAANWGVSSWGASSAKYVYDRQTMAFYAQDNLDLAETLSLDAGGRFERAWNTCTMAANPGRINHLVAWDVALNSKPIEDFKGFAKFSVFYRMPFIDEVAYSSRDDLLSPERGWRVDTGFEWKLCDELDLAGSIFLSRTMDEIFYNPFFMYPFFGFPAFGDNVNASSPVVREGADIRVSWERDKVAGVMLACNFVDAAFDGGEFDGNAVPMVAATVVSAAGRVWIWDDCFVFGGYRFRSECRSISDFENEYERIPAFGLFHAGVKLDLACIGLSGFSCTATVDNLFDKNFCDYSTYGTQWWPGAGRSCLVTLRYSF